ncbi:MAG: hypothetical protein JWR07_4284 [Nevskia sp.]|nr:hypothetical protein [Nevskia sp.]
MKVAISIPDPVFAQAEHLAQQLKKSRSQLYSEAIADYVGSRGAVAVTEKLNAVYGATKSGVDSALERAQLQSLTDEAW